MPIDFTELPVVTEVNPLQFRKAPSPIDVTAYKLPPKDTVSGIRIILLALL
jgi:hypothetical protein